jgi:hypothetical protein
MILERPDHSTLDQVSKKTEAGSRRPVRSLVPQDKRFAFDPLIDVGFHQLYA